MIRAFAVLAVWSALAFLAVEPFLAERGSGPVADRVDSGSADSDSAPPPTGLADRDPPLIADLPQTTARPLFTPTRRPPAPEPPPRAAPAPLPRLDGYRLTGIVRSSAKVMILLQETATGRVVELHEGERIEGWTVTRIEDTTARLVADGREIVLSQDAGGGQMPSAGGRATRWLPSRP